MTFFDCRELLQLFVFCFLVCTSFSFSNVIRRERSSSRLQNILWMANSDGNNDMTPPQADFPKCYVVLSNIQSGSNVGSICRNALAFNVDEVIVVGRRNFRDKMRQADRGAKIRQKFVHFNSVAEAQTYLKNEKQATIVGIEILDNAVSLTSHPFTTSTAFMFGNEGGGLSPRQREACDLFVYIPQYAAGGMASINVACASAVVLESFAVWAKYPETQRVGEKFLM